MSTTNILEELQQSYLSNFPSRLEEMENLVLELEKGTKFQENFEALYRNVHSIKGSGGTYGFTIISSICHQLEDFLSDELNDKNEIEQSKVNIIFAHIDLLKETHDLLMHGINKFSKIEAKLHKIKQDSSSPKLRALIIDSMNNMYGQICSQILSETDIQYSTTSSSVTAIQRLIHEQFDLLITSRENPELSGTALIAAMKLDEKNKKNNFGIKFILITSNPNLDVPKELEPDYVIVKSEGFSKNLSEALDNIISEA